MIMNDIWFRESFAVWVFLFFVFWVKNFWMLGFQVLFFNFDHEGLVYVEGNIQD